MPKRQSTSLKELEKLLCQPGHKWKNRGHMLSVFLLGAVLGENFNSARNAVIYGMYLSNWIEITPERPHHAITIEELANTIDRYIPDIIYNEAIYRIFNTTRNTFKTKYEAYLNLPKEPTTGDILIAMDRWTDSNWSLMKPIRKKDIASLKGMHHKKLSIQITETPQLKSFLWETNLTYSEIKGFPPRIVEDYFDEIGEPEKYRELVHKLSIEL